MSWPFDIEHRIKDDLIKSDDAYSPELRARVDMWYRRIFAMRNNEHPPLNAPAGSSGFTAAVSDQPALKLTWYIRDEERVRCKLPPDGLWNAPTPCGATLAGFAAEDRAAAEAEHFRTCRHGCRVEILGE